MAGSMNASAKPRFVAIGGYERDLADRSLVVVEVKGTGPNEEIVIVRNGRVIHTLRPQKPNASFTNMDEIFASPSYYYVRVSQIDADEHGNHSHAWSSPIRRRQLAAR